ncbi:MAG: glycosyltransferase [Candidatus Xenobiia bacterium LiM19]
MSATFTCDVLILGELCGNDLVLAEHLSRKGLRCAVARWKSPKEPEGASTTPLSSYHTHFREEDIWRYRNCIDFLQRARRSRLIVSFTGSLIGALGRLWPLRHLLSLPPVVNCTTGSDILERVVEDSPEGRRYREYLRFASLNGIVVYPVAVKNVLRLRVPRVIFYRIPYYTVESPKSSFPKGPEQDTCVFLHASNLDWGVKDAAPNRQSTKGNDRFIRAFARAVNEGLKACCVMLDRGPDREEARQLIQSLGVAAHFQWKGHLSRDELMEEYMRADVVVDQFDVGCFGGIAIEAMALGKPVMVAVESSSVSLLFPEMPPVLNCRTEDEIYREIMRCRDPETVQILAVKGKEWVDRHYNPDTYLSQFLFYYSLLTGHCVPPYTAGTELPKER